MSSENYFFKFFIPVSSLTQIDEDLLGSVELEYRKTEKQLFQQLSLVELKEIGKIKKTKKL